MYTTSIKIVILPYSFVPFLQCNKMVQYLKDTAMIVFHKFLKEEKEQKIATRMHKNL